MMNTNTKTRADGAQWRRAERDELRDALQTVERLAARDKNGLPARTAPRVFPGALCAVLLFLISIPTMGEAATARDTASTILTLAGSRGGLCIHIGAGTAALPDLAAELALQSGMLVHAIAFDAESEKRARVSIAAAGSFGAQVEQIPLPPLPYPNNVASLVVVEDANIFSRGIALDDLLSITSPGGALCVRNGDQWTKYDKPWLHAADEWTHPAHGANGNRVSSDTNFQYPAGLRWADGLPLNFNSYAACRAMVIAGGRCFSLTATEIDNLPPASFYKGKQFEYVVARDAFSGLPLWKFACGTTTDDSGGMNPANSRPLVTDGKRVYVNSKAGLIALDAATGKIACRYPTAYTPIRLLLDGGVMVAAEWEDKARSLETDGKKPPWKPWVNTSAKGAVEAFDAQTGTRIWSLTGAAAEVIADDGALYALFQSGNPVAAQSIAAFSLTDGSSRWRTEHSALAPELDMHLMAAHKGTLIVNRPRARKITVLSGGDGRLLWEAPGRGFAYFVKDAIWYSGGIYDPLTGNIREENPLIDIRETMCTPTPIVGNYIIYSRFANHNTIDGETRTTVINGEQRGSCVVGFEASYGMLYAPQNFCRCTTSQLPGFVALEHFPMPPPEVFAAPRPLEKGPAFGSIDRSTGSADDWPVYMHDVSRGSYADIPIGPSVKPAWRTAVWQAAKTPLVSVWSNRLAASLTAPVIADGIVVVASVDEGVVSALDAATGAIRWRVYSGSRIDTPPTLYQGMCLFGSHDGWLYAHRIVDGERVWRMRIAPAEKRIVAFGRMESAWPVIGSVAVADGVAYATAGRSSELPGGIALMAVDVMSGAQKWAVKMRNDLWRQNDLLACRDGALWLHQGRIDMATGMVAIRDRIEDKKAEIQGPINSDERKADRKWEMEGLIDGSWTRLGTRRSGRLAFGSVNAEMFAWDANTVFGYAAKAKEVFAVDRSLANARVQPGKYSWSMTMPEGCQPEAMILGRNALVLGVRECTESDTKGGCLWFVDRTGKKIAEVALNSPVVYEGLALAKSGLFVSLADGSVACYRME